MNHTYDGHKMSQELKEKMYRKRLSVREAAVDIGTSPSTLCRVMNGGEPNITTLYRVCQWMRVRMENYFNN